MSNTKIINKSKSVFSTGLFLKNTKQVEFEIYKDSKGRTHYKTYIK